MPETGYIAVFLIGLGADALHRHVRRHRERAHRAAAGQVAQ